MKHCANRFWVGALLVVLTGCTSAPTSALVHVDASGASVQALFAQIAIDSRPPGLEEQTPGPVQLPGTLVIWLPDATEQATISLRAVTIGGQILRGTVSVASIPHQQVEQSVTLTPSGVVGGGDVDAGPGVDAGFPPAPDLSGVLPNADLSVTPSPDLSTGVIALDDFHRPGGNLARWGTASDGQTWGGQANSSSSFSIANNKGLVFETQSVSDSAVLGPSVADADLLLTVSITLFASSGGKNELGPMLRAVDDNRFYKAGIDGNNLRLFVRTSANQSSTLSTVPFPATPNTPYNLRFRAVGTSLMAKAWPASATEPPGWMVTANDANIAAGACGIRLVFNATATASFTSFVATRPQ